MVKVETFLQSKKSHTKYRQNRRRFPRLKVIAYDINDIWSFDLAYVSQLAKNNNCVKFSHYELRVRRKFLKLLVAWSPNPNYWKYGLIKEANSKEMSKSSLKSSELAPTSQTLKQNRLLQSAIFDFSKISSANVWRTNGLIAV